MNFEFEFAELQIPEKANVYYAINTAHDLNFILREKSEDLSAVGEASAAATAAGAALAATGDGGAAPAAGGPAHPSSSGAVSARQHRPPRDSSKARRRLLGIAL